MSTIQIQVFEGPDSKVVYLKYYISEFVPSFGVCGGTFEVLLGGIRSRMIEG